MCLMLGESARAMQITFLASAVVLVHVGAGRRVASQSCGARRRA